MGGTVWLYLIVAIVGEVIGTAALKASDGFARPGFGAVAVVGYGVAFYFLAQVLRTVPIGIAYAIWSGLGIALVTVIGLFVFGQRLDTAAVLGIALITAGVIVLNVFSNAGH